MGPEAQHGLRVQSKRHARIARLLGIEDFVVAVNKMDLVDFSRDVFDDIRDDFETLLQGARCHAIPLSALHGDNVITRSARTPWFDDAPLLAHLETVDVTRDAAARPFRFPVQLVARPHDRFRGYAGQIASGVVRVGDPVVVWPSGRSARVMRIVTWDGDLEMAFAPMSVTLTLDEELDISRGDLVSARIGGGPSDPANHRAPHVARRFEAEIVWMDDRPLEPKRLYLLKHTTRTVTAEVGHGLVLNQVGAVTVSTTRPLVFDAYRDNRTTGSFVLVDPATCFTAGAGMITRPVDEARAHASDAPVSAAERLARLARGARSDTEAIDAVARALEELLT